MDLCHGGWAKEVDAELRPSQGAVPHGSAFALLVPESPGFSFRGRWVHA